MGPSGDRPTVEEALARWLDGLPALGPEEVAPAEAAGRVLARPVRAAHPLPPFRVSAVDGYAVRAADLAAGEGVRLLPGAAWAGGEAPHLAPGCAVFVATGAPVPPEADAVLPLELAQVPGAGASAALGILRPVAAGANLRLAGEDAQAGEEVLAAGERIDRDRLPLLLAAAAGGPVAAVRRPRVRLLPVGDELVPPGRAPSGSRVTEVVGAAVAEGVRAEGGEALLHAPLPDDPERVRAALAEAAAAAELVVTVGGASVGKRDHVASALRAAGGEVRFHGLRLRPGTPALGGRLGASAFLGLPGNPAAALTVWELFGRAALARLLGRPTPPFLSARLARGHAKRAVADDRYLRAALWADGGGLRAAFFPGQNAGRLVPLARTNALALHPAGRDVLAEGDVVRVRATGPIGCTPPSWLDEA
jgi:molybdopterin molybdotransferase